jgi:hypothetical protein
MSKARRARKGDKLTLLDSYHSPISEAVVNDGRKRITFPTYTNDARQTVSYVQISSKYGDAIMEVRPEFHVSYGSTPMFPAGTLTIKEGY